MIVLTSCTGIPKGFVIVLFVGKVTGGNASLGVVFAEIQDDFPFSS